MLDALILAFVVIYFLVVGLLFVYGLNFFYLTYQAWRAPSAPARRTPIAPWPHVTVQLPIYNEMYVAERLVRAAARLDYPPSLLEIQVLDDSTDETADILGRVTTELARNGVNILHVRRGGREGFKAGALAYGLERAKGEFIALFDADFVPSPDFLLSTLACFQDPKVAFVQTRWGHVNRRYSLLTFLQSLAIDAHFMVEQFARSRAGFWFNFNGTAGIWRRTAMVDAGGWRADTLTEDLDLSYRAFLQGWQAIYLRDVEVPAELPVSASAYRRQQHRWARGSLECAIKLIPRVWRAPIPLSHKVQATLHLSGYGIHILLFLLALIYPVLLLLPREYPNPLFAVLGISVVFNATALAPSLFFVLAQRQLGRHWWQLLPAILCITALGAGMMLNTLRAALGILSRRSGTFERTPKFGISDRRQDWLGHRYQLRLDPIVYFELVFALFNLGTALFALSLGNWSISIYAAIFAAGLVFTSGLTIGQALALRRERAHAGPRPIPVEAA